MNEEKKNKINEPEIQYGPRFYVSQEEQEIERLKESLAKTDEQRFTFLMSLMKFQKVLSKATIVHK